MKRPALDSAASATRPVTATTTYLLAVVIGRYRTIVVRKPAHVWLSIGSIDRI